MERVFKRYMTLEQGGGPPDTDAIRAARHNIRYHLAYIGWLVRRTRLAGWRRVELRRSCRGGAFIRGRLSGRCAVERGRGGEELVRAGEVAPVVPRDPRRLAGRDSAGEELRRPRLLTDPDAIKAALVTRSAHAWFRRHRRDAARCGAAGQSPAGTISRRRRAWRHGLAGSDRGAAHLSIGAVAGRALGHHARHELRAGRRPAARCWRKKAMARSRSMRVAKIITS